MANLRVLGNEIDIELEKKLEKGMWFRCDSKEERHPVNMWIKKDGVVGKLFFMAEEDEYLGNEYTLTICTSRQIKVFKDGDVYQVRFNFRGEGNDPLPEEVMKLKDIYKNHPFIQFPAPIGSSYGPAFTFMCLEEDFTGNDCELTEFIKEVNEIEGVDFYDREDFYAINTMFPYYEMMLETIRGLKGGYKEFINSLPKAVFRAAPPEK